MHPTLKSHCRQDLHIYPCTGIIDGDKNFGTAIVRKCYSEPKIRLIRNLEGVEVTSSTTITLDGTFITDIKGQDEVELNIVGRRPIINLQGFPSIYGEGYEHLEVYI